MKRVYIGAMLLFLTSTGYTQPQVTIIDTSFSYVYMEFQGLLYQIPQNIRILMQEAQKQDIMAHILSSIFVIQFYSNLQVEPSDDVWGLGFRVPDDMAVNPPLKKAVYEYEKVARTIYVGPYETASQAYNTMIPFIDEENMEIIGPPIQMYLDDPSQVPPESCRTEILIPVKKLE